MRNLLSLSFRGPDSSKLGYVPALDGLRALAVIAVMLFHFKTKPFFPGGGLGVDLFFVLSGFLITTLLLQEWSSKGSISLAGFYLRRVLRLVPALVVFVTGYVAVNLAFHGSGQQWVESGDFLVKNVVFVATYLFNWRIALGGDVGSGLSHLWSLSVEEQFYLFSPLILLMLLRARIPAIGVMTLSACLLVLSAFLPLLQEGDWTRFYYGTDFRIQSLMAGSLLGQLYAAGILRPHLTGRPSFRFVLAASAGTLIGLVLYVPGGEAFLFYGGHTLIAFCSAVLIWAGCSHERHYFTRALSHEVLVYIGKRSYALYLWHAALNVWLESVDAVPHFFIASVLSFLCAELSFRLVESPALSLKSRLSARRNAGTDAMREAA